MASQILSGASNPSYTNNTGQNVRIIINYMYSDSNDVITLNWAGVSITEGSIEAIGKNIASATAFYGDLFLLPFSFFRWWWRKEWSSTNPRAAISCQNVSIKIPTTEVEFTRGRGGFFRWLRENSSELSGFSISVALPLELYLAPGQTFSAVCGPYNIVAIKEDGT